MNITEFLEARIAEDEAKARTLLANTQEGYDINEYAERVLAECAAKRAILSGYDDALDTYAGSRAMDHVLEALAAVYKDHPTTTPTGNSPTTCWTGPSPSGGGLLRGVNAGESGEVGEPGCCRGCWRRQRMHGIKRY